MVAKQAIKVGALKESELDEAARIVRLAFGTFLGVPNPAEFMGDRNFMAPRWRSSNVKVLAARADGRLIGTNVLTRWGSFAFFGPLTILPEYWDKGVAQRLLTDTMAVFDRWDLRHSGLFTFPHSAKHIGLYQKFGYWPGHLTAIMKRQPENSREELQTPALLSKLNAAQRRGAIAECAKLTGKIDKGLDLTAELGAVMAQGTGDVVLTYARGGLEGFAVCMNGVGSEGGEKTCYVKFGAARSGKGASERFDRLLEACDAFARARNAELEAGVSLASKDAFLRMRAHGYRAAAQGVKMHRPHQGFDRADAFVMEDWR